jgi:hypothetical protein
MIPNSELPLSCVVCGTWCYRTNPLTLAFSPFRKGERIPRKNFSRVEPLHRRWLVAQPTGSLS